MSGKVKALAGAAGLILLIAAAALAYNTLGRKKAPDSMLAVVEGQGSGAGNGGKAVPAPDFSMTGRDVNEITLSAIIAGGKPVVLNFWASWCPPCKVEMPEFDKVYREMGNDIQFMMVDITDGHRETVQAGTDYIQDNGFTFPVFFDTKQEGVYTYGIRAIPTTLFINTDGYIVTYVQGAIDEETLLTGIQMIQ